MRIAMFLSILSTASGALAGSLAMGSLGDHQLATALAIAAGTLISEDLTCIATGLLIGRGELSAATGVTACFLGIFLGDLGLWAIGHWLGRGASRWPWLGARLPRERLARLGDWLQRHAPAAIVTARFVPGLRLPLYVAAGAFGITFQGVVLFRRAHFHQLNLADHFGGRMAISYDPVGRLTTKLMEAGVAPSQIQAKLGALIKQEAAILSLNDAFLVASGLFLVIGTVVWFAHPTHLPLSQTSAEELRELRAEELIEEVP